MTSWTRAEFLAFLAAAPAALAQGTPEWDFLGDPSVFLDVRGMLSRFLHGKALGVLERRRREVDQIRTAADLEKRRARFRTAVWEALGGQPARTPLHPHTAGVIDRGDHRIEKVIFESRPGFHVTANVYVPASSGGRLPAVVFPCGHESGGKAHAAWQRCLVNLARRGFLCLIWDPLGQGERVQFYDRDWNDSKLRSSTVEHTMLGLGCHLLGTHIAQFIVWDGIRALDYLLSRPDVDPERIGCTGNSGGGTQTAYLAALDDRIGVAAPSCYVTSWQRLLESIGPQDAEQVLPLLAGEFDFPDFLYAFGPKPYLVLSAIRDFFPIGGARASFEEARRTSERCGAGGRTAMFEADDGHGYTQPRREAAYRWFTRWLKGVESQDAETPVEVLSPEELNCTPEGQVALAFPSGADVHSLCRDLAVALRSSRPRRGYERARELSGFAAPVGHVPVARFGEHARQACRVERLTYDTEPGVSIPALLFLPAGDARRRPAVVLADGAGKRAAASEAEELAAAGMVVLAPDLRGLGETEPPLGQDSFARHFGDYRSAATAYLLGMNLPGMRAADIAAGFSLLAARQDVDAERMGVAGRGLAAVPALLAAVFDPRVNGVVLEGMLASFEMAVLARIHQNLAAQVIPSALRYFDLPDLVAALAPRKAILLNTRDASGNGLLSDAVRSRYAAASSAYNSAGARDHLQIVTRNREESRLAGYVRELLQR